MNRMSCVSSGMLLACLAMPACKELTDLTGATATASSSSGLPDPNGKWLVTAHVTSCNDATGSDTIVVSGGKFATTRIFSYTKNGTTETVSIAGTISKGNTMMIVEGTQYLTGTGCNGGNPFYGYLYTSKTSGTVNSFWGELTFVKK